jgi:hypothetical protein
MKESLKIVFSFEGSKTQRDLQFLYTINNVTLKIYCFLLHNSIIYDQLSLISFKSGSVSVTGKSHDLLSSNPAVINESTRVCFHEYNV